MKINYSTLLNLIPREADRDALNLLVSKYDQSVKAPESADPSERSTADLARSQLMDQIMEKIQWHFKAMRRPMPTREEVAEMVQDHFE